jgi:hypothetical protein
MSELSNLSAALSLTIARIQRHRFHKRLFRICHVPLAGRPRGGRGGALIAWAMFRGGTADRRVKRDLDTLLALFRVKP